MKIDNPWIIIIAIIILADIYAIISSMKMKTTTWSFKKLSRADMSIIRTYVEKMDGRQFEEFIHFLFEEIGESVSLTQETNDAGKDLIIHDRKKGDIYVELKHWNYKDKVGRPEIQKLIGACVGDNIRRAIFISTSGYNKNAIKYAKTVSFLELWDMNNVEKLIKEINSTKILRYLGCDLEYCATKTVK